MFFLFSSSQSFRSIFEKGLVLFLFICYIFFYDYLFLCSGIFLAGLFFRDSRHLHVTASGFGAGVRAVFCSFFFSGRREELKKSLCGYLEKTPNSTGKNTILPNNHFSCAISCEITSF